MRRLSSLQSFLLAGTLATLLVVSSAFAQQAADQPAASPAAPEAPKPEVSKPMPILQPQPTTVPGRPDIPNAEVAKQLRNVAPLPLGAPEDKLPVSQFKLPKGFKAPGANAAQPGEDSSVTALSIKFMLSSIKTGNARQKSSPRDWTGPTVSRFTEARFTSLKAPRFPSSKTSRTISTTRRSPP